MPNTRYNFSDTKFLVIDRDATVLAAVGNYLQISGARATQTAGSTLLGLDILNVSRAGVDCVICAHDVTPISGLEFLKNLRSGKNGVAPHLRGIKFIMLTAHREMALVQVAVKLDVNGYITKPFDQMSFTRGIHHALAHHMVLKPASAYSFVDISEANRLPVMLTSPQA